MSTVRSFVSPCRIAVLVAWSIVSAPAAGFGYSAAQEAVKAATAEFEAGDREQARQWLADAVRRCGPAPAQASCRALVAFNQATLSAREALTAGSESQRREWLLRSAALYRRVLEDAPGHLVTLENLAGVLAALGDSQGVARMIAEYAPRSSAADAGGLRLAFGDAAGAVGKWDLAYEVYRDALERAEDPEVPLWRLADLAPRLTDNAQRRALLSLFDDWSNRAPSAVERGYLGLARAGDFGRGEIAEQALLKWVEMLSVGRRFSAQRIREAFDPVSESGPVAELIERVEAPFSGAAEPPGDGLEFYLDLLGESEGQGWWLETPDRRHVLARVCLSIGQRDRIAGDPGAAERRWQSGLHLAPPITDYLPGNSLAQRNSVPLDLLTELVLLVHQYPDRDPERRRFQLYVRLLFESKGQAYRVADLASVQRHHTILGRIFAVTGPWRGQGYGNAEFQLRRALETAARRQESQPLPDLQLLLAEGYQRTGDVRQASGWYLDAAQAYLEADAPSAALNAIEQAQQLITDEELGARALSLERIAATRSALDAALEGDVDFAAQIAWLDGPLEEVDEAFLERQRFKAVADLAELEGRAGRTEVARERYGQALALAQSQQRLSGTGDLLRLESAMASRFDPETLTPAVQLAAFQAAGGHSQQGGIDSVDVSQYLAALDAALPQTPGRERQEKLYVTFDPNQWTLNKDEVERVRRRLARIRDEGEIVRLEITGHSDSTGTQRAQERVARLRAREAERVLMQVMAADPGIFEVGSVGGREPLRDCDRLTGAARAGCLKANRRVDIGVVYKPMR